MRTREPRVWLEIRSFIHGADIYIDQMTHNTKGIGQQIVVEDPKLLIRSANEILPSLSLSS